MYKHGHITLRRDVITSAGAVRPRRRATPDVGPRDDWRNVPLYVYHLPDAEIRTVRISHDELGNHYCRVRARRTHE